MKIQEVPLGYTFNHGIKGECTVINRTKRTITIIHKFGKTKVSYRSNSDAIFSVADF